MSDCNTSAFEPKQPRMLCTGCLETAKAKDIEQRYEQLAQVAIDMYETLQDWYQLLDAEDAPNGCYIAGFAEQLEALGVGVDD